MGITVNNFVTQLKSKQLKDYTLPELQVQLQVCHNLYKRFNDPKDRDILNLLWNKMGTWYNTLLNTKYPQARAIYANDYLKTTYGEGQKLLGKRKRKVS